MLSFRFAGFKFLVIFCLIRRNCSFGTVSDCRQTVKISVILFQCIQLMANLTKKSELFIYKTQLKNDLWCKPLTVGRIWASWIQQCIEEKRKTIL